MNNELGYVTREAKMSLGILVERAKLLEEKVKLLEVENKSLRERESFLLALEATGVDNWSGYDYAHSLLKKWKEEDEAFKYFN
ncbi:hypothetical protein LCGC14_3155580, partial [marine sediment metagenome]